MIDAAPMTQQSEERVPESGAAGRDQPPSARILPFERRSELQRAIQVRAQETLDRERDREREERRPKPLKWLILLALAAVPVLLTLGAVDGFLRVMQKAMLTYGTMPAATAPASAATGEAATHEAMEAAPAADTPSTPGVVLLQSYPTGSGNAQPAAGSARPAENAAPAAQAPAQAGEGPAATAPAD